MNRQILSRAVTAVDAQALVGGRLRSAIVSQLSNEGCRIRVSHGFVANGDQIILRFGDVRILGDVARVDGRDAVVKFRSKLHDAMVLHLGFRPDPMPSNAASLGGHRDLPGPVKTHAAVLADRADVYAFFE